VGRYILYRMTRLSQSDCGQDRGRARALRRDGGGSKAEPSSRKYAAQNLHSRDDGNHGLFKNVTKD